MPTTAIIVAAGSGSRMGGEPKQFRLLGDKPVLAHAVDAMASHPRIDAVRVVVADGQVDAALAALGDRDVTLVTGGAERHDSVRNGLAGLAEGIVLIHDAARPFCPTDVIDRLIDELEGGAAAAVPVLKAADTLARGNDKLEEMVDRRDVIRVQTPQAFHVEDLLYAMAETRTRGATDESSIVLAAGLKVATVAGSHQLDKLTTEEDWARAEAMLSARLVSRTGMGFDVHAFAGDGPIVMGGLTIPHDRGLAGHSDADVVLHSITDALLGAAGLGDIGQHFPPSDAQWKGADSAIFLAHATGLVRGAGGMIDFVDCTVICETPKVGPHREAMRARVAAILDIGVGQVSIKATTTERLGFTGRREGIAAQAVATIRMPVEARPAEA